MATIMGLSVVVLNYGIGCFMEKWEIMERVKSSILVIISLGVAIVVYFTLLLYIGYDKEELKRIPILSRIFRKLT